MLTTASLIDELVDDITNVVLERHGDADAGDWREEPVHLQTFVESPDHLGLPPLYPVQMGDAIKLLGPDPRMIFGGPEQANRTYELDRIYQVLVALWGKGAGKDYLCSILCAYLIYVLLCLRDPQRYFGLAPGENIDGINVAYNADQAKRVFFHKFKARLRGWKWLRERYNVFEAGKRLGTHKPGRLNVEINDDHVLFPRAIRMFSRHAQNESYEGMNLIFWLMDEASAFLSKLKRENADAIEKTLRSSAKTRFKQRWVGFIISYPRHADDFTMQKIADAQDRGAASGLLASGPYKCWDVNLMYGAPDSDDGETWVETSGGLLVPISLLSDYEDDLDDALAKYECKPPMAVDALIKDPARLWACVAKGRKPVIEWEPVVTRRTVISPETGEPEEREYSAVRITNWGKLPRGTRLFFHGDPAVTNDAFALAIGHGKPQTIVRTVPAGDVYDENELASRGLEWDDPVEWEQDVAKTIIDAVIVWRPDPRRGRHVDLLNVDQVIKDLCTKAKSGHRVQAGSFDQYESASLVQHLQSRKVAVENEQWGNNLQLRIYKGGRRNFYNGLVELPDTPSVTSTDQNAPGALYELSRVQLIENRKVDHPEGGSKDIADTIVRVIEHVTDATTKGGFSFASAHGHASAYNREGGRRIPSSEPIVDPDSTPSPATAAARAQDAANRSERPFGEVTPAPPPAGARAITASEAAAIAARTDGSVGARFGSVRR